MQSAKGGPSHSVCVKGLLYQNSVPHRPPGWQRQGRRPWRWLQAGGPSSAHEAEKATIAKLRLTLPPAGQDTFTDASLVLLQRTGRTGRAMRPLRILPAAWIWRHGDLCPTLRTSPASAGIACGHSKPSPAGTTETDVPGGRRVVRLAHIGGPGFGRWPPTGNCDALVALRTSHRPPGTGDPAWQALENRRGSAALARFMEDQDARAARNRKKKKGNRSRRLRYGRNLASTSARGSSA